MSTNIANFASCLGKYDGSTLVGAGTTFDPSAIAIGNSDLSLNSGYLTNPNAFTTPGQGNGNGFTVTGWFNPASGQVANTPIVDMAPPSNPLNIMTGCSLWFDATDSSNCLTIVSGAVTGLLDKSGAGNHATTKATTGTNSATLVSNAINGLPALNLQNTGFGKTNMTAYTGSSYSFFCVATVTNQTGGVAGSGRIFSIGNTSYTTLDYTNNSFVVVGGGSDFFVEKNYNAGGYLTQKSYPFTPVLITGYTDGTNLYFGFNGSISSVALTGASLANFNTNIFYIGVDQLNGTNGTTFSGWLNIGEMLLYQNSPTVAQRQQIEGYLATKWKLQAGLPTNHPYYSVGGFSGFVPSSAMSNCTLWFDANDPNCYTGTTGAVTGLIDKSGMGNNTRNKLTTGTNSATINYNAINGLPALNLQNTGFDGSMNAYGTTTAYTGNAYSFFCVMTDVTINTTSFGALLSVGNTDGVADVLTMTKFRVAQYFNTNQLVTFRSTNGSGSGQLVITFGTPFLVSIYFDGTNMYSGINGVYQSNASTGAFNSTKFAIGSDSHTVGGSSFFSNMNLGEMLVYQSAPSLAQRQSIEGYLATKWGLQSSLPATHPYFATPAKAPLYGHLALCVSGNNLSSSCVTNSTATPLSTSALPTVSSTCTLWLDASDNTSTNFTFSSGSTIATWKDKSASAYSFTIAGTAPTLSANALNGRNMVNTTAGGYFYNSSVVVASGYSMFVVAIPNLSNTRFIGSAADIYLTTNNQNVSFGNGSGGWAPGAYFPYNNSTNPVIYEFTNTCGTNGTVTPYLNGTASNSMVATSSGFTGLYVGAGHQASIPWSSYLAEVLIYNSVLSQNDRLKVEGYLATKWGLQSSLPSTHPYFLNPTLPLMTITPNAWNFFGYTVCCSGATQLVQNLTVNGTTTSTTGGTYSALTLANTYVGYGVAPYAQYFNGKIDDFRYYNRCVTPMEMRVLYSYAYGKSVGPSNVSAVAPSLGGSVSVVQTSTTTAMISVPNSGTFSYLQLKRVGSNGTTYTTNISPSALSASGASYVYSDTGLTNLVTYIYTLTPYVLGTPGMSLVLHSV